MPTCETERLTLRPWTPDDAGPLHRILGEEGVLRYFPDIAVPSLDRVERFVARQMRHWQERSYGWWAVELRSRPGLIGWNGLQYLDETGEVEVGYLLCRDQWHQGLAAEGARVGLRFGFEVAGLDRIIALVHPDNTASQRVAEKLGLSFVERTEYFGMPVVKYVMEAGTWSTLHPARRSV